MGSTLQLPSYTTDGRQIVLPSTIADNMTVQFTGIADDVANGVIAAGAELKKTGVTTSGDHTQEFQFITYIDICGGTAVYSGAGVGDHITYQLYAPGTDGVSNPGAGSFDKVAIGGGINQFVPAENGDWDLDLEETLNANVGFTKIAPIPYPGGPFAYDHITNELTVSADGSYIVVDADFTFPIPFVQNAWILDSCCVELLVPGSYSGKRLLPHWIHKVTVHKEAASETPLHVLWYMFIGR